MAFVGILSTQALADQFLHNFDRRATRRVSDFRVWHDQTSGDRSRSAKA
jgi:hypothetical protein